MPILSLVTSIDVDKSKQKIIAETLTEITTHQLNKKKEVTVVNIVPLHGSWFSDLLLV